MKRAYCISMHPEIHHLAKIRCIKKGITISRYIQRLIEEDLTK